MSEMDVHVKYLSCGVNATPFCCDWGGDGIVCYAAHTGIVLYDPKSGSVTGASTKVHTKRITCVRWIQSPKSDKRKAMVSTGADGKAVVWTVAEEKKEDFYILRPCVVLDHEDLVSLADGMVVTKDGQEKVLVVTATTDVLTTWLVCLHTGTFERVNASVPPAKLYIMSLRLYMMKEAMYPILVCGGHDSKVHVLTSEDLGVYVPACVLPGHEDWLTALNLMTEDDGDILLASGSKDSFVRIWRLSPSKSDDQIQEEKSNNKELKLKSITFKVKQSSKEHRISVSLEAVLAGHEGMVSEVCWAHPVIKDQRKHQPHKLLTCSKTQDRSIIIWQPQEDTSRSDDGGGGGDDDSGGGLWLEVARLGEVGGNMEGYYTCHFGPNATHVLGCSYQGGLHLWEERGGSWEPCVVVGGHFNQVADITWDPLGRYLLSTSKDQTTRLHAPWVKDGGKVSAWHEVGRPQVHGYDLFCITSLGHYSFASGAEEKVIRAFTAPTNFISNFGRICKLDVKKDLEECGVGEGASVPSLGLSNKAVLAGDLKEEERVRQERQEEVQAYFTPLTLSAPPTEDQLMQNTLWPESAKLYGHGNELITLAATSDGSILASATRAANIMDAHVILWDTDSWQKLDSLEHHRLTVTHLSFSPDDCFLLAVSRDRTWSLYQRHISAESALGHTYKLVEWSQRKEWMHSRVIWCGAWLPDSTHFMTASRDKTVGVWGQGQDGGWARKCLLSEANEVTALAVTSVPEDKEHGHCVLVATGLVCGAINIRKFFVKEATFSESVVRIFHQHHDTVRSLSFRPQTGDKNTATLASCGNDMRVMLFDITIK